MPHVAFVRSTIAHAVIEGIDTSDAVSMPGVVAVYTADDLDLPDHHGFMMLPPTMNRPPLARDRVRFVGDIVAMVVAETKAQAVDAAEAVIVDYDPLPVVVDMEAAILPDAPVVFEAQGSNIANGMGTGPVEGVLDDADVVVTARIVNQRVAPVPMEPAGIVAVPGEPDGGLTFWAATQGSRTACATSSRPSSASTPRSCAARTRRSAAASAPRPGRSSSTSSCARPRSCSAGR